jgi:acetoin utilization protein AcuC
LPRKCTFIHSKELDRHGYPSDCPFNSHRAERTFQTVSSFGLLIGTGRSLVVPTPAVRTELERFHSPRYLDVLERASRGEVDESILEMGLGTADTPIFLGMYDYAALACGASLLGARMLLSKECDLAFNPSGGYHHAHPQQASGFCFLNDVVLACLELRNAGKKVLFLDLDVHHCDGVSEFFYNSPDVMTLSLHESGKTLFPGTGFTDEIGAKEGLGFSVNIPLPVGTYDGAYDKVFREVALPLILAFQPDALVVEFGMDTLAGDPLAHLDLTNNEPALIARSLLDLNIPMLATGGGGYHVSNTARAWSLLWSVFVGEEPDDTLAVGLGGVMLHSTDWIGGLRDRELIPDEASRQRVDAEIDEMIAKVKSTLFPFHGLKA